MLSSFSTANPVHAQSSAVSDSEQHPKRDNVQKEKIQIREWFRRYDGIRRDSEMTAVERVQSVFLLAKTPEKRNAALAKRMFKKYTGSLSALKELEKLPETLELHEGYIEYFDKAVQLFSTYLDERKEEPFTDQSFNSEKKKLEELDRKNKKLDEQLRRMYNIPRH